MTIRKPIVHWWSMLLGLILGWSCPVWPKEAYELVDNFRLLDVSGRSHELSRMSDRKAVVLIAHSGGCPILEKTIPTVEELKAKYASQKVDFFYLNASIQDDRETLLTDAEKFGSTVPILKDDPGIILNSLKFKRSTETVVLIPEPWRIVYRGPIDDRFDYAGDKVDKFNPFLKQALDSIILGKSALPPSAEVKGCLLSSSNEKISFRQVAPILQKKCLNCHAPGKVRPDNMSTIKQIQGWAPMIREVIRTGRMPPWLPDPHYGRFLNDMSLTPEQSRQIITWIEAGAPFDPKLDPEKIEPLAKPLQGREFDLRLRVAKEDVLPASGTAQYRAYALGQVATDRYVKKIEIVDQLGLSAAHHFVLVSSPIPIQVEDIVSMRPPDQAVQFFLPPGYQYHFPEDVVFYLPRGSYLYVLGHYELTGRRERIQPEVRLWYTLEKSKPFDQLPQAKVLQLYTKDIDIPPGERKSVEVKHVLEKSVWVYGLALHMHYRGRSGKVTVRKPDGQIETLLSIPSFSLGRASHFRMEKPIFFPAGSEFSARGEFDNSVTNPTNPDPHARVKYGPSLKDEMFHAAIHYFVRSGNEPNSKKGGTP